MVIMFFWVLFAIAVGVLANNRGRNWFGWFTLSIFISPLLGLIFCLVSKNLNAPVFAIAPSLATHRKCPQCAEFILPEARICKHCGLVFDPTEYIAQRKITEQKEAEAKDTMQSIHSILAAIGFIFILVILTKCAM